MRKPTAHPIRGNQTSLEDRSGSLGKTVPDHGITDQLKAWSNGDSRALDDLVPLIYDELRQVARRHLASERAGHTLQPTALVHEVYLRLESSARVHWESRAHFFGSVARLMRQILVDHARRRNAEKRGDGATLLTLDDALGMPSRQELDLLALEEALSSLAAMDPRQAQVVELRFFGGLTIPEVASLLEIGTATVERDWRTAKAWLLHELRGR